MEDLVGFADGEGGGPSKADVVFVFAGDGAEDFVGAARKGGFAQTAVAFGSGHFGARFDF